VVLEYDSTFEAGYGFQEGMCQAKALKSLAVSVVINSRVANCSSKKLLLNLESYCYRIFRIQEENV
jgi:hypothetical protein